MCILVNLIIAHLLINYHLFLLSRFLTCLRLMCEVNILLCNMPSAVLVAIHHNELRDLTGDLLSEVCNDVGIEPTLQPLHNEPLHCATANREDGARLNVVARDFWGQNRQHVFFDIRVFNPFASCYSRSPLSSAMLPMSKRRGVLMMRGVFSASGGMGPSATTVYKKLASETNGV